MEGLGFGILLVSLKERNSGTVCDFSTTVILGVIV